MEELKKKYNKPQEKPLSDLEEQPQQKIPQKKKMLKKVPEGFESKKEKSEDDRVGSIQEDKKRKIELPKSKNTEEPGKKPKKQKVELSFAPAINKGIEERLKDVQKPYSQKDEQEKTIQSWGKNLKSATLKFQKKIEFQSSQLGKPVKKN